MPVRKSIQQALKKKHPKNDIYVFSPIKDDPAFAKVKPIYIRLDDSIIDDELQLSEFSDSICVFDDVESISNKGILEAVRHFCDMCLEAGQGRHPAKTGSPLRRAPSMCAKWIAADGVWPSAARASRVAAAGAA